MLFQHDNRQNLKQFWFTNSVYCGIQRRLFHAGLVRECFKEEAEFAMSLKGCLRVIQPNTCYKGSRMDEELKKQPCVENIECVIEALNLMKMGYQRKTSGVINLKKSRLEPDPRGLNPDKGIWRLFLEGAQLKHLNQRNDPIKVCFRKISQTVLLVQAAFSLEERERDLLGSHLQSYQVW